MCAPTVRPQGGAACYVPGTVRAAVRDGMARVSLAGEHDLATLSAVEAALRGAIADGRPTVVDLSGCTFIDCAVTRAIGRWGDDVVVVVAADGTAEGVRRLLDLMGVPFTKRGHPRPGDHSPSSGG